MRSIRRTLLAWILGALLLGAVLVTLVSYLVTLEEMNEVFDGQLRNVAEAVASYQQGQPRAPGSVPLPERNDEPEDIEIVTLSWTADGQRVYISDPRVKLPFSTVEGLARPVVDGEGWIVYTAVRPSGVAQAAQRVSARKTMAVESATEVVPYLVGLIAVVGALLLYGLRRGLKVLDTTARDVARRSERALDPIVDADAPQEIVPLVASINALMARLGQALAQQRRFMADAAHELRTPVTALRLQLQWLQRAHNDGERQQATAELAAGIDRSQRLVEQLLQVARMEPDGETTRRDPLDLAELVRSSVGRLSVKAQHAGIDLGAVSPAPVPITGDSPQLTVLLDNLIENALRYTPPGGVVDVESRLEGSVPVLTVRDNGPGIPEDERPRVFDRFFRGDEARVVAQEGSGLGLAIVKAIAERHGATVSLGTPASGRGLEVTVRFRTA